MAKKILITIAFFIFSLPISPIHAEDENIVIVGDPVEGDSIEFPVTFQMENFWLLTSACIKTVTTPNEEEKILYDEWQRYLTTRNIATPVHCEVETGNYTHKLEWGAGHLHFHGYDLLGPLIDPKVAPVLEKFLFMQRVIATGQTEKYFDGYTVEGKNKHSAWFAEATQELRDKYIDNIVTQKPIFIIDAYPVYIVYTRGGSNLNTALAESDGPTDVQVAYFVLDEGDHKLSGGSTGTFFDNVFQSPRFVKAAQEEIPFNSWRKEIGSN